MVPHKSFDLNNIKALSATSLTKMTWNLFIAERVDGHFVGAIPTDDRLRGRLSAHLISSMVWAHRGKCINYAECDLVGKILDVRWFLEDGCYGFVICFEVFS